jgi:hypothetical protein
MAANHMYQPVSNPVTLQQENTRVNGRDWDYQPTGRTLHTSIKPHNLSITNKKVTTITREDVQDMQQSIRTPTCKSQTMLLIFAVVSN